jgi:PAS domain S-box-containing protein
MIVPDAALDPRFHDNPLVLGPPKIRFYAGYPLSSGKHNLPVGTLCLIDTRPRIFRDEDRKLLGEMAEIVQDEFKIRDKEALLRNEERFNVLLSKGLSGFFDHHFKNGGCYFSPRWKEILGYTDSELPNNTRIFRRLVHPEDEAAFETAVTPCIEGINPYCVEFRMRHKEERWLWIESRGIVEVDEQITPVRHLGFITDITKRRETMEHLLLMKHCFEKISEGVLITNAQFAPARLSILHVNPAFEKLTGFSHEELIGSNHSILNVPFLNGSAFLDRLFLDQKPIAFEGRSFRKNGSVLHGSWTIFPLPNAEGSLTHFIMTLRELNANGHSHGKEPSKPWGM